MDAININFCKHCEKIGEVSLCSKCRLVGYCNRECQKKDWKKHKLMCVSFSKNAKSASRNLHLDEKNPDYKLKEKAIKLLQDNAHDIIIFYLEETIKTKRHMLVKLVSSDGSKIESFSSSPLVEYKDKRESFQACKKGLVPILIRAGKLEFYTIWQIPAESMEDIGDRLDGIKFEGLVTAKEAKESTKLLQFLHEQSSDIISATNNLTLEN
jgi:hypothetical protein